MALLAQLVHGFRPVDDTPHGPVRWVISGDGSMAPRHLTCLTLRYIRRDTLLKIAELFSYEVVCTRS